MLLTVGSTHKRHYGRFYGNLIHCFPATFLHYVAIVLSPGGHLTGGTPLCNRFRSSTVRFAKPSDFMQWDFCYLMTT